MEKYKWGDILKRLGIFSCYDSEGIIDDYIIYLLDDISKNLDELCIVSTGNLTDESINKLEKYSSHIILKSDGGFDAEAFKHVLVNHYGFDYLSNFDEVILFNDTFFGPIYPFKNIFEKMDDDPVDFWGITRHAERFYEDDDLSIYEYVHEHLQTYFLAFRKDMVMSSEFQKYWQDLPKIYDLEDLHIKHEDILTKHFENLGFNWKSYVDTSDLELSKEDAMDLYSFDTFDLVVNKNLPVLNRESFKISRKIHLQYNMASDLSKTIDYLDKYTDYDVSLIYRYFLRKLEPSQVADIFNLVRIFPKNQSSGNYQFYKRILLIAHLYYDDLWEYAFNYFKNVPEYIDILITTDSEDKKEFFEKNIAEKLNNHCILLKINSRGRDMASLFVASKDILKEYDYFCFMHDKKSAGSGYITAGATFRDVLWENNLASPNYIENIIKEFDENPLLGLIVPPKVFHSFYFGNFIKKYWVNNYNIVLKLLNQMEISTIIDKKHPPLSIGNCFWAKYDALKPLFDLDLTYEDFPEEPMPPDNTISHALERIYGYVAASEGYYTEVVMTEEYARSELENLNHMLLDTFTTIKANQNRFINYSLFNMFNITVNDMLIENNKEIVDIDKKINQQNKKIEQKNKEIAKLKRNNKKLKNEKKEILSSSSWKITKPLRKSKLTAKRVLGRHNETNNSDINSDSPKNQTDLKEHIFSIKNYYNSINYSCSYKVYASSQKYKRVNIFIESIDESIYEFTNLFSFLINYCNKYDYTIRVIYKDIDFCIFKEFLKKNNFPLSNFTYLNFKKNYYLEIGLDEKYVCTSWKHARRLLNTNILNSMVYFYLTDLNKSTNKDLIQISNVCYKDNVVILNDNPDNLDKLKRFNYNYDLNFNDISNIKCKTLCFDFGDMPLEGIDLLDYLFSNNLIDENWNIHLSSRKDLSKFYSNSKKIIPRVSKKLETYDVFLKLMKNDEDINLNEDNYIKLYLKEESDDEYDVFDITKESFDKFHNLKTSKSDKSSYDIDELFNELKRG